MSATADPRKPNPDPRSPSSTGSPPGSDPRTAGPAVPKSDPVTDAPDPGAALKDAAGHFGEAGAYALQYASVQLDRTLAFARNLALTLVLLLVLAIVGVTVLVVGVTLLVLGLAGAISAIFSPEGYPLTAWPGQLIVGGVLTLLATVGTWIATKWIKSAGFAATVQKYEALQRAQQQHFGHHAAERARQPQPADR